MSKNKPTSSKPSGRASIAPPAADRTKKFLVSLDAIADMMEVTPRRINQLVKTDAFPRATKGQYDVIAVFGWMKRKLDTSAAGDDTERAHKTRLVQYQAELKELEVAERRGELWPRAIIQPEIEKMHNMVRTKMMALGNDVALDCAHLDEPTKIKTIIDDAVRGSLEDLAGFGETMARKVPAAVRTGEGQNNTGKE